MRGVGVGKDVDNATMRWSWCCLIRNSSVWESLDGPLTACIGLSTPSPPSRRVPSSRYFQPALPRRPGHLAYPVICNYDCFTSLPSCRLSKQYKNQSWPRPSMNLFQRLPLPVLHLGKIPMLGTSCTSSYSCCLIPYCPFLFPFWVLAIYVASHLWWAKSLLERWVHISAAIFLGVQSWQLSPKSLGDPF